MDRCQEFVYIFGVPQLLKPKNIKLVFVLHLRCARKMIYVLLYSWLTVPPTDRREIFQVFCSGCWSWGFIDSSFSAKADEHVNAAEVDDVQWHSFLGIISPITKYIKSWTVVPSSRLCYPLRVSHALGQGSLVSPFFCSVVLSFPSVIPSFLLFSFFNWPENMIFSIWHEIFKSKLLFFIFIVFIYSTYTSEYVSRSIFDYFNSSKTFEYWIFTCNVVFSLWYCYIHSSKGFWLVPPSRPITITMSKNDTVLKWWYLQSLVLCIGLRFWRDSRVTLELL